MAAEHPCLVHQHNFDKKLIQQHLRLLCLEEPRKVAQVECGSRLGHVW